MTRQNLIITLTPLGFAVLCNARAAPQRSRSRSSGRRNVSKRSTPKPSATQPTVPINTLKQLITSLITAAKKQGWWSDDDAKNMGNGLSAVSQPEDLTTIHNNLNINPGRHSKQRHNRPTEPRKKTVDATGRVGQKVEGCGKRDKGL